jgi:hypothetical protein
MVARSSLCGANNISLGAIEQACKLISPITYRAKILKKYSTKQNSTWTIEGVTYQRIIAPNLSSKDGLSKEIRKS